jgi:hypothetical protein
MAHHLFPLTFTFEVTAFSGPGQSVGKAVSAVASSDDFPFQHDGPKDNWGHAMNVAPDLVVNTDSFMTSTHNEWNILGF